MKRREFVTLVTGAAAFSLAHALNAHAQQSARPTVGFLGSVSQSAQSEWTAAFVRRLRELGWIDGRTVTIEYRWAEGSNARAVDALAEFVRLKVDVIVTNGTPIVIAAKRATTDIPIVFAAAGDPVGTGVVASLSQPGGNVTGLSLQASDLAGKHVELLREALPKLRRLAMVVNVNAPNALVQLGEARAAARTLGIDVDVLEIRRVQDIAPAIDTARGRAEALYVMNEPLTVANRVLINELALGAGLPTVYAFREFVDAGGLISYGPSFPDLFRRAADYVDKILRGTKAAHLPVQQPTRFDLVVNLKTARALGLQLPVNLLMRADEVIE
jgi:putative tryptophan/tyrosine transport system substrate-binding protein